MQYKIFNASQMYSSNFIDDEALQQTATFFTPSQESPEQCLKSKIESYERPILIEVTQRQGLESPPQISRRPGVKYKIPHAPIFPKTKTDNVEQNSQRVPLKESLKRNSHSFQMIKKQSGGFPQSNSQVVIKALQPSQQLDQVNTKRQESPKKNIQKPIDIQKVVSEAKVKHKKTETQPLISFENTINSSAVNFLQNHERFINQVNINLIQQNQQFQNQKSLFQGKIQNQIEKMQQLKSQKLDISVININDSEENNYRKQSVALRSPPRLEKIVSSAQTPETASTVAQVNNNLVVSQTPSEVKQTITVRLKKKLSQGSIQLYTNQSDSQVRTQNTLVQAHSVKRLDYDSVKFPQIIQTETSRNMEISRNILDSGMRKSKTAQDTIRELQKEQSQIVFPIINVQGSPYGGVTPYPGTLQGFGQINKGKSFLTRRPQAKIVSRIFSSKSENT